ncbi:MAG: helix-turn-helix domain-containing protein [Bacteroidales bacterium]|nr:helix-turn-helix domain-containing protein [Bacteroidales bacterium]
MENEQITTKLSKAEIESIKRLVPVLAHYVETQVDALVAKTVGRYMNLPLSVDMVAQVLGERPKTIYKWSDRGRLHFTKKCGRLTITIQELNRQLTNEEALNRLHENLYAMRQPEDSQGCRD